MNGVKMKVGKAGLVAKIVSYRGPSRLGDMHVQQDASCGGSKWEWGQDGFDVIRHIHVILIVLVVVVIVLGNMVVCDVLEFLRRG